eukprot:GEZU01039363.1.p1 GENE.GEZU01039363.1~~GEZU01039363.1.p1  ORF type:complete len:363 (-),score=148.07 GEZU01039363.1:757-1845(-)
MEDLPVVDLAPFLENPESAEAIKACKQVAQCLHETGVLILRDPRVSTEQNNKFLDMMERYYNQPFEVKKKDARPQFHYQIGCTPEFIELPRDNSRFIDQICDPNHKPLIPTGPDPKWRYFWRIGERPEKTEFPQLNEPQVVPEGFPEWTETMDTWGSLMLQAVTTVAEMAAIGFDLPKNTFTDLMKYGPHLLAPTGSDLSKYNELNTIFAGFHYDLNFLTIHGKSRFPGLEIWLRNGKKIPVRVPEGCLLVQAGKQIEYLTAGEVLAGFHQVIVVPETLKAIEKAKAEQRPLWRVSSTLFSHIASDNILQPLGKFANVSEEVLAKYPPIKTGHQVQNELFAIKLGQKQDGGDNSNNHTTFVG